MQRVKKPKEICYYKSSCRINYDEMLLDNPNIVKFVQFDNKKHVTITGEEGTHLYSWSLGKMLQNSGKLEDVHIT